jgi:hypothetical protein
MIIRELRGYTATPVGTSGLVIEVDCASYGVSTGIEIVRVIVQQTAGTGSFTFSIGNKSGFVTKSVNEKYLSASTAYNVTLDETNLAAFCTTSDNGKLYFKFLPASGSNNTYTYSVMYRR